jgi:ribose transport system ATP-binding protein
MRGIRKAFGATLALDGVELAVAPGEVCALVGQNGAGKSTLMGILSGALQPDGGGMTLDGAPYRPRSPLEARRAGVAMIYQEPSLAPDLSVMENIVLGLEPTRLGLMSWRRARRTAAEVLAQLAHPEIAPEAAAGALSPAGQQLVEIARALAVGCRVLVLDEPTSSLGREDVRRLFELVERLRAQGHAIVYISHFIEEVRQVAGRFVVLRDGRNVGGGPTKGASHDRIVSLMVGRDVGALYPRGRRVRGEPVLELEELTPGSAGFTLHRGEVLGIAGLVGAGRTELLRALFGLRPVRGGRVRLGAYTGFANPGLRWRQGMGFVSEDRKEEGLALPLSVGDNLTLTRLEDMGPAGLVLPGAQARAARRWIERLSVRCASASQPVAALSGGNQQKVALARLLHHDVDVLLLDEPTRGIDVGSKAQIYALIDGLVAAEPAGEGGACPSGAAWPPGTPGRGRAKAVLLVSSYFPELLGLCDRIAVMCRGRLGPARPAAELDEHRLIMEATGAGAA